MADPSTYRPPAGSIPTQPGVYRFRDPQSRVIYVGKAGNLRQRLSSYFSDFASLHPRTQRMVTTASSVDWVIVGSDTEALALEYSWIKEFDPRFNVRFRDDKSYPYLAVTTGEKYPRVGVVREAKKSGTKYFGPFAQAWAIRATLEQVTKVFGVRTCRDGVFRRAQQTQRACLLGYIDRCSAPCVDRISEDDYRELVDDLCSFMSGDIDSFIKDLKKRMELAARAQEYEEAARLRDRLGALVSVAERNAVVLSDGMDADLVAIADSDLDMVVEVFHVRAGRIVGERSIVVEKTEDLDLQGYVFRVLQRLYAETVPGSVGKPPREVLVTDLPAELEQVIDWLSELRGSRVEVRVPQRGEKATLLDRARINAEAALHRHHAHRSADLSTRGKALEELRDYLDLADAPLRIECIDISTLQGSNTVASIVVFEDGLPRKNDYRTMVIRTPHADDLAAMREVVTRRYSHPSDREQQVDSTRDGIFEGNSEQEIASPLRFSYDVALLVVDGGSPQVQAAQQALLEVGRSDLPVVGLAKRLEEVWVPGDSDPVILPRTSEGLYLLQRIRDEAHRVAIGFHRKRRTKSSKVSALDAIPGLGPTKSKSLLKHFGSVAKIRSASTDEIAQAPGIGPKLAEVVKNALVVKVPQESTHQEATGV
jgi:excinuclease ABC subunit C